MKKYTIGISSIGGNKKHLLLRKSFIKDYIKYNIMDSPIHFLFYNKTEAINCRDYMMLKLVRFCLSVYKMNEDLRSAALASVPYMPTYDKPWTNEEVAKEIGLTDEELQWCLDKIPNYYPEDY